MRESFLKIRLVLLALIAASLSCSYSLESRAEPRSVDLPAGIGPLPALTSLAGSGAIVAGDSVRAYRAILPEPLFDLVKSGEWAFEAARLPHAATDYGASSVSSAVALKVSAAGELSPNPKKITGPLFSADAGEIGDGENLATRAYKVLWNVASSLWRFPYSNTQLSLVVFRESISGGRRMRWSVQRMYPGQLDAYPGTLAPLFREKISGVLPTVLDGLHWLTIRSLGDVDDYVWVASPITGHVRRMTATNRSDQIFAGAFAADDLFVWSGKVERVKPTAMARQTLLVAFAKRALVASAAEAKDGPVDRCQKSSAESSAVVELNETSRRFHDAAGYVPSNIIMSPRRVVRIDVASQDPFSRDLATTLYVDEVTSVPVYKVSYGRDGRISQFTVGVVGSVATTQGLLPLSVAQVILYPAEKGRAVLSVDSVTVCRDLPRDVSFTSFDPGQLVPKQEALPTSAHPIARAEQSASETAPSDSDD